MAAKEYHFTSYLIRQSHGAGHQSTGYLAPFAPGYPGRLFKLVPLAPRPSPLAPLPSPLAPRPSPLAPTMALCLIDSLLGSATGALAGRRRRKEDPVQYEITNRADGFRVTDDLGAYIEGEVAKLSKF